MFIGDTVYVERILGVGAQCDVKSWIAAFEAMSEDVLPSHLNEVRKNISKRHGHDQMRRRQAMGSVLRVRCLNNRRFPTRDRMLWHPQLAGLRSAARGGGNGMAERAIRNLIEQQL